MLHRFVFNLKRILKKVGLGSRLGSFGVALNTNIKEDKSYAEHKDAIESESIITYLKEEKLIQYVTKRSKRNADIKDKYMTCFGVSVYEKDGELVSEDEYAKTL